MEQAVLLIYLQGIESGTFLAFWPSEKVKLFLRKCLAGRYWRTLSRSISPRLDLLKLVFFSRLIRTENSKGETKAGYAWRGGTALLACCRITWQKEKTTEIYQHHRYTRKLSPVLTSPPRTAFSSLFKIKADVLLPKLQVTHTVNRSMR
jgi:hypothetical protein